MRLRDRYLKPHMPQAGSIEGATSQDRRTQDLKAKIHYRVIEEVNFDQLENQQNLDKNVELENAILQIIDDEKVPLSIQSRRVLVKEIVDEVMGLGPLEPLIADPSVSDILVNRYDMVFVERSGKLEEVTTRFRDEKHLRKIIDKIVSSVGRRIDEASPMVDARLIDGSRVNAIIPPLTLDGSSVSIRKFAVDPLTAGDLIKFGSLDANTVQVLEGIIKSRLNVLISGGTGSGKTTLLNVISSFIPGNERIITIEDSAELQLQQRHVVRLETRPPNLEGQGNVTQRDLVRNSLRMRPDRIIIGEVRAAEALDMLQAMNTGHDGSLSTIHANTPRDALSRLETMIAMSGVEIPRQGMRHQISSALDVIIQLSRLADGKRKLVSLQEITGMEGESITMQEIFKFEQTGINNDGEVMGVFGHTGIRPNFMRRLEAYGIRLDNIW